MATIGASKKRAINKRESFTTEQLWAEISKCMGLCAEHMIVAADCVRILDDRAEDMSRIKPRLLVDLRKIAAGTLLPEAAIKLAQAPQILTAVSALPMRKQQALLDDPTVDVVRKSSQGFRTVHVPLISLRRHEVGQVFCGDKIRTTKEQAKALAPNAESADSVTRFISVPVTQADYDKLTQIARDGEVALCEVVRAALRDQGLI